jgi:hypothetical protein
LIANKEKDLNHSKEFQNSNDLMKVLNKITSLNSKERHCAIPYPVMVNLN